MRTHGERSVHPSRATAGFGVRWQSECADTAFRTTAGRGRTLAPLRPTNPKRRGATLPAREVNYKRNRIASRSTPYRRGRFTSVLGLPALAYGPRTIRRPG